jgi:hypothetical protein
MQPTSGSSSARNLIRELRLFNVERTHDVIDVGVDIGESS